MQRSPHQLNPGSRPNMQRSPHQQNPGATGSSIRSSQPHSTDYRYELSQSEHHIDTEFPTLDSRNFKFGDPIGNSSNDKLDIMLLEIRSLNQKVDNLHNNFEAWRHSIDSWKSQTDRQIADLRTENGNLKTEVSSLKTRTAECESFMRRKNIIIYGLDKNDQSSANDAVSKLMTDDLRYQSSPKLHATWLGGKENRPVLAEFDDVNDKVHFQKTAKETLPQESSVRVKQDIPPAWRSTRRKLVKFYKEAIERKSDVKVVKDYLIVDNERYDYDEATKSLIHVKGSPDHNLLISNRILNLYFGILKDY